MDYFNVEANENFLVSKSSAAHVLGIWGNLTKNPRYDQKNSIFRYKSIDIIESHISMSIPKPLSLANVAVRIWLENGSAAATRYEAQDTERHMSVVGGVLYLDLVELPEMAKNVDKWVIRPSTI